MSTADRTRDRGRRNAERVLRQLGTELRDARLSAGVSQNRVAAVSGLSQPVVSRVENAMPGASVEALALLCTALGLRLNVKTYPEGTVVRDAGQLRSIGRFRERIHPSWRWATEVLVGSSGDQRAWDVRLAGPGTVGIDAETRLHDLQALQRRCEAKARNSGVDRVVLLVAATHHNGTVLRDHREAPCSTFPLDTRAVLAALSAGTLPTRSGLVVL